MGSESLKNVQKKFKLRGLTLTVEALKAVTDFVNDFTDAEDEALELVLDEIDRASVKTTVLDKEAVQQVLSLLTETNTDTSGHNQPGLRIVDVFLVSKFCYDPIRKMFYEFTGKLPIHSEASGKAALYRDRLQLLQQRLSRDRHFARPAFDSEETRCGSCEGCDGYVVDHFEVGPSNVLPRCALPRYFSEEVMKYVPNAIFSSNPCRIKFYTQEIVLFRQDMLYRMRRSCVVPPSREETTEPFEHLVATVTHQSHLCPLPLTMQPAIWNYDHCLRLYPTPHTIVLADKSEQTLFKYTGVTCFNPGSFANDGTFVAYRPATQEVELSAL